LPCDEKREVPGHAEKRLGGVGNRKKIYATYANNGIYAWNAKGLLNAEGLFQDFLAKDIKAEARSLKEVCCV
jgi:hypothetical protein